MHRLAFGDFHSKHFGPEQKAYWQSILKQQQQQQQQQQQYHQHQYQQQFYEYSQYETEEQQEEEQDEQEQEEQYYPEYEELSKEAIEIFQFSEAYRKEKESEQMNREKDDTEGMQDWQYDESTVLCSGGIEAPATSLVLTQPKSSNDKIRVQEDLLNSAYLNSCRNINKQEPVILWPVLPFKM